MTMTVSLAYAQVDCPACGFTFAVPESLIDRRRADGKDLFCPAAGHPMNFGTTETERLRAQLASAERRLESRQATITHLRDQCDAAERATRAQRGVNTKLRKRISNGVCPCCNRTFADLAKHMAGQHPDFSTSDGAP
jgi:hypothetical protein